MKTKTFLCFLALCFAAGDNTYAAKKKNKVYLKLLAAYTQQAPPGIQPSPPLTGDHFVIVWEAATYPETFFWRGEGGWLPCRILKAHKAAVNSGISKGMGYITESLASRRFHTGDTLELSPVTGGKFPVPDEIPADAKNTLFFKTGGSGWLSLPVKKIAG